MQLPFLRWLRRRPHLPLEETITVAQRLIGRAGEAEGTKLANQLARNLEEFGTEDLTTFFTWLVTDLAPPHATLIGAASAYIADPTVENAALLTSAAEPPRQELLRRLNTARGGTALIVRLRAHLLKALRSHPGLAPLDADMRHLLSSWFNRGFLELRRIDWNTSAAILEKLIQYEAVHAIGDWNDLRERLEGDRRCYGFFHPSLPDEPLIFIEVALTNGMDAAIAPLLEHRARREVVSTPSAAIFYSISNCQAGLRGISFGNFLIKQIVGELRSEIPSLDVFATLSPVPGFCAWLEHVCPPDARPQPEDDTLADWCALYLSGEHEGRRDPVAHFHLSNGARLERINPNADLSAKGHAQSAGVMVNYLYLPEKIEVNHQAYVGSGVVDMSPSVRSAMQAALANLKQVPA